MKLYNDYCSLTGWMQCVGKRAPLKKFKEKKGEMISKSKSTTTYKKALVKETGSTAPAWILQINKLSPRWHWRGITQSPTNADIDITRELTGESTPAHMMGHVRWCTSTCDSDTRADSRGFQFGNISQWLYHSLINRPWIFCHNVGYNVCVFVNHLHINWVWVLPFVENMIRR